MGRRSGLAAIPAATLQREYERRQAKADEFRREYTALMSRIVALKAKIKRMGFKGESLTSRLAGRARNAVTLPDALATALKGRKMPIAQAMEAVRKAGYRTSAPSFRTMVTIALGNKKRFKRVERGVYTAK